MAKRRKTTRRTGKSCRRRWTAEEDQALADWSAAGCDDQALGLLSQTLDRTVRALKERARLKGLWQSRQGWELHEIAQIVAWAKVHGTSAQAIAEGLRELGIEHTVGAARHYLYREGVLLRGELRPGKEVWNPPQKPVGDPGELLPPELVPVYRRLTEGQREVADSISTYDVPAFVRYVRAVQFWSECPKSVYQKPFVRGCPRAAERCQKTKSGGVR